MRVSSLLKLIRIGLAVWNMLKHYMKAVFSESCFRVILSQIIYESQFDINIVGSMISGYWRSKLPKSSIGSTHQGVLTIEFPVFLSTMWYLVMAEMAVKTTDHETFETLRIYPITPTELLKLAPRDVYYSQLSKLFVPLNI